MMYYVKIQIKCSVPFIVIIEKIIQSGDLNVMLSSHLFTAQKNKLLFAAHIT